MVVIIIMMMTMRGCNSTWRVWDVLEHPRISLTLTPTDFHLFGSPKEHLTGKRFETEAACSKHAV
jgi:hypothetical protein